MIDPYKHVQVVSALEAEIKALQQENERLREAMQEFVDRCDRGIWFDYHSRYAYGPSYTVRLHRSLFKTVYGGKLARHFRKGISGYHCLPL